LFTYRYFIFFGSLLCSITAAAAAAASEYFLSVFAEHHSRWRVCYLCRARLAATRRGGALSVRPTPLIGIEGNREYPRARAPPSPAAAAAAAACNFLRLSHIKASCWAGGRPCRGRQPTCARLCVPRRRLLLLLTAAHAHRPSPIYLSSSFDERFSDYGGGSDV